MELLPGCGAGLLTLINSSILPVLPIVPAGAMPMPRPTAGFAIATAGFAGTAGARCDEAERTGPLAMALGGAQQGAAALGRNVADMSTAAIRALMDTALAAATA